MSLGTIYLKVVFATPFLQIIILLLTAEVSPQDVGGYCASDANLEIGDTQVPGKCETYNDSPCLCNLNDNCEYFAPTSECRMAPECTKYSKNAALCRLHHCVFNCRTSMCTRPKNVLDPSCEEVLGSCHQFCFDPCTCKISECEYLNNGQCQRSRETGCPASMFPGSECGRLNAFYSNNGEICQNLKERGNCEVEGTVFGANMNGTAITDSRGITYIDNKEYAKDDISEIKFVGDKIIARNDDNKKLYEYMLVAKPWQREIGRCNTFTVKLCGDGSYELTIKTAVIKDVLPGEKLFNIKLNDIAIFQEVDIMKLAKKMYQPVELIQNFRVQGNKVIIRGYDSIPVENDRVLLSFCFSCCIFAEGGFEIAAASVSKFYGSLPAHVPTMGDCALFNGVCHECEIAGCKYELSTHTCQPFEVLAKSCFIEPIPPPPRPHRPPPPPPPSPPPSTPEPEMSATPFISTKEITLDSLPPPPPSPPSFCVEMLFMVDNSHYFREDPHKIRSYATFNSIMKQGLVDRIRRKYKGENCTKFGIYTMADFHFKKIFYHHHIDEGCFLPHIELTTNYALVKEKAKPENMPIGLLCRHTELPLWFSAMLAINQKRPGFTKAKTPKLKKFVVMFTHKTNGCKYRNDPRPYRAAWDDEDVNSCIKTWQPPYAYMRKIFRERELQFVVVVHKEINTTVPYDKELNDILAVSHKVFLHKNRSASQIVQGIVDFVDGTTVWPPEIPLTVEGCPTH